jgi:hypothetical protein
MLGLRAKDKINSDVIVYMGLSPYIRGTRATAAIIAEYAKKLKATDPSLYNKRFSNYIREGLNVEDMPKIFEEIKQKIIASGGWLK